MPASSRHLIQKPVTDFLQTPRTPELWQAPRNSAIRCHHVAVERAIVRHADIKDASVAAEELYPVNDPH